MPAESGLPESKGATRLLCQAGAAEAEVRAPATRVRAVAQRRGQPFLGTASPASAAIDLRATREGWPGIISKPVVGPLPDVAGHVVQPKRPRSVAAHAARPRGLPAGALLRGVCAPGVAVIVLTAARCVLPLELGRQP